ncbi:hypothetical protein ACFL1H_00370 [Nanoarchaeota archaeon]
MTLESIVKFFKVTPAMQFFSAISLFGLSASVYGMYLDNMNEKSMTINAVFAAANLLILGVNELISYAKYDEYKKVKSKLEVGWDENIVKKKSRSWCQRHLTRVAADETDYGKEVREYHHNQGYRWYHFIPDFKNSYKDIKESIKKAQNV